MGQVVFVHPIAMPIHPAEQNDHAVTQSRQAPDLQAIQRAPAWMGPGSEDRRQEKHLCARPVGLVDFPRIMHWRAMPQPSGCETTPIPTMNPVG